MDSIQQEINMRKSKLLNLINNLINAQLIDDEIAINNEIKTESECLKSLLNIKQNNFNKNYNVTPFMVPPTLPMNQPIISMTPIISSNINYFPNNEIINVKFKPVSGHSIHITINRNEKISELIRIYREQSRDFYSNMFLLNGKKLEEYPYLSLAEYGIRNGDMISVWQNS